MGIADPCAFWKTWDCLDATVAGFVEQTSVAAVEDRLAAFDFGDATRAFGAGNRASGNAVRTETFQ